MNTDTRELLAGLFLLLLGAAVLLVSPVLLGERPAKWELWVGGGLVGMGLWLVSPDGVTDRINTARDALPFLEDTDDDDA